MNEYIITDFGADPCGNADSTEAIQKALDSCFLGGGGKVIVPRGTFASGDIRIRSNTELHLCSGARLIGSRDIGDYFHYQNDKIEPYTEDMLQNVKWSRANPGRLQISGSRWNNGFIRATNAENIAITGEGDSVIDGADCFDELGEEFYRGPHAISLWNCRNVRFEGYTVYRSGNWAHKVFYGENFTMKDVHCIGGHDGAHFRSCDNISIENCTFRTGDDCIAGFDDNHVRVSGCTINSACSAFRFGGTDVIIENCRMYGPADYVFRGSLTDKEKRNNASSERKTGDAHRYNMLSAFTYFADRTFGIRNTPGNIVIRNCRIENADRLLHYNFSGNEIWQCAAPLEDITFENITAEGVGMPLNLYGDEKLKTKFVLRNSSVRFRNDENVFINAAHFDDITLENVETDVKKIVYWGEPGILEGDDGFSLVPADKPFSTSAI